MFLYPPISRRPLGLAVGLALLLLACAAPGPSHPPPDGVPARPVWGPLEPGGCVGEGLRRYSAVLHGSEASPCEGPFHNVMGAHFERPTSCSGSRGSWEVRDHACASRPGPLPDRGADGGVAESAEGYADLHNHLFAHVAFGETVVWGKLWGAPAEALAPIPAGLERAHQRIEGFSSARGLAGAFGSHGEHGHPSYADWPTPHLKTHQQTYVDWLFRAYQGGLRLVVAPAVNNQDMFGRGENPLGVLNRLMGWAGARATPAPHRTSNDMEALEFQVRAAHAFERWVAEHQGGWLAVAETPEEAAQLIEAGRLAVVLGSEVDHLFNCDLGRRCEASRVEEHLSRMEALGLAVLFPTHHKVNQFGDAANFQPLGTGPTRPCPGMTMDCAALGLTAKGEHLVREMMARGLLVDLGHAGAKPFDDTVTLFEAERYPTMMTHASAHPLDPDGSAEYTLTFEQLRRIDALDGLVSIHAAAGEYAGASNQGAAIPFGCTQGGGAFVQSFLYTRDAMGGGRVGAGGQIALAPDWNGFADWPGGRFAPEGCGVRSTPTGEPIGVAPRLVYPFALPKSMRRAAVGGLLAMPLMDWQGKRFDFNEVGLAHAGLQPDLLEDMRLHGLSEADLDPLYRSARGFIEMWRRARDATVVGDRGWLRWIPQSATDLIEFEHLARERLVEHAPGRVLCRLRSTGQIGSLVGDACEPVDGPRPRTPDELVPGEIRNANSGMCLAVRRAWIGRDARVVQATCDSTSGQRWQLKRRGSDEDRWQIVAPAAAGCLALGDSDGAIVRRDCDASPDHTLRLERVGNTFRLRPDAGRCLHVADRSLREGDRIRAADCPAPGRADFHWEIDALRDAADHELLFSTRSLEGTVAWSSEPDPRLPHLVRDETGRPLCRRLPSRQLGFLVSGHCGPADDPPSGPANGSSAGEAGAFELLRAASPLGQLPERHPAVK